MDNVTIPTVGIGSTTPVIATDDVAGAHFQRVKLDGGANGLSAPILADAFGALKVTINANPFEWGSGCVQVTTTQTALLVIPLSITERMVVTKLQIQAFGTNAGDCIVYFGDAAYVRGTDRAVFDGHFIPSTTLAPGVVLDGPFGAPTVGVPLSLTTTNNLSVTVNVQYYVRT